MAFTFFFRDQIPLELAAKNLCQKAIGRSTIRVWDAGCAMGPEPYTLAMILAENMGRFAFSNLRIYASDYDQSLLKIMDQAIYPWVELQRVPEDIFQKYFEPAGDEGQFRVKEVIRSSISVHHHDLLSLKPLRDDFSLVVCKNVLLHFQPQERLEVYRMFHQALEPGGFLLNEYTQKLPQEMSSLFEPVINSGQLYRKIGQGR
jgi:chemotaxis protein methyltransferase CheR